MVNIDAKSTSMNDESSFQAVFFSHFYIMFDVKCCDQRGAHSKKIWGDKNLTNVTGRNWS